MLQLDRSVTISSRPATRGTCSAISLNRDNSERCRMCLFHDLLQASHVVCWKETTSLRNLRSLGHVRHGLGLAFSAVPPLFPASSPAYRARSALRVAGLSSVDRDRIRGVQAHWPAPSFQKVDFDARRTPCRMQLSGELVFLQHFAHPDQLKI